MVQQPVAHMNGRIRKWERLPLTICLALMKAVRGCPR
jgi:hypothetical protein